MRVGSGGHWHIDHVTCAPAADVVEVAAAAGVDECCAASLKLLHATIRVNMTEHVEQRLHAVHNQICQSACSHVLARCPPEEKWFITGKTVLFDMKNLSPTP